MGLDLGEGAVGGLVVGQAAGLDDERLVAFAVERLFKHGVGHVGEVLGDGVALLDDLFDRGFQLDHGFLDLGRGLADLEVVGGDGRGRIDLAGDLFHRAGDVRPRLGDLLPLLEEKHAEDDHDDRKDENKNIDDLAGFAHYRDSCNCVKII